MRTTLAAAVLLVLVPVTMVASQTDITLKVLSSLQQTIGGVGVGVGDGSPTTTVPCSQPFPDDAISVSTVSAGSVSHCTFAAPSSSLTGTASGSYVKAALRAPDGSLFYVYLSCYKRLSTCPALKDNETYPGRLNGTLKQFVEFVDRHEAGVTKVLQVRPNGKTKVSYRVISAVKVPSQP